ncbi:TPA: hypothetical protein ACN32D_003868 [Vibrio parahaemolyticus]|uniref:hypothetical protein n=2 Tax=Vibrio parahaemolyticus TaxID=670 RepID=UPI0004D68343|nr:hypothetical protein [Vibrio parahaemolyticus]EGQ7912812.1 hypothetical protein [Vibrio parahaemolyticus]EGQ9860778.1 hypothetical protein [Vibrio parahaemolyticus]EGW0145350.1 hypothetical protein [Vibrio parahaemolyticus]EIA1796642.1 hypothetical protein [Vibrio parahaemolyticus]EII2399287.1 hypothetical protein [Vibrio parahaemolyticus]
MVYLVEEPDPGEIIIVEAKGGSSPLGSRKIGNEAYQQGTSKYAAEIVKLMSENKEGTTEKLAADEIQSTKFNTPLSPADLFDIYILKRASLKVERPRT